MTAARAPWLSAHGKLWYDDRWYRIAWIVWPQALALLVLLWFWASPSATRSTQWAKPMDAAARSRELATLRDKAANDRPAADQLERFARGGEMDAQFFYATLFDPELKLSKIMAPDIDKTVDNYTAASNQGHVLATGNLASLYYTGVHVRTDYTRACSFARRVGQDGFAYALFVRAECHARGLGGTPVDLTTAANAYEIANNKGNARAGAALGYFYENGLGGRPKSNETALRYYRAAADKGDALGLHNLGAAYNSGLLGLQRDPREAARLIARALDARYAVTVQSLTARTDLWSSDFWAELQRRLSEKGTYTGVIDGRPNSATLDAIRRLGRS
jgi:uncharacterized protein